VTREDVIRAAEPPPPDAHEAAPPPAAPAPVADTPPTQELALLLSSGVKFPAPNAGYGAYKVPPYRPKEGDQVVPFTRRRRLTADHMVYSKLTAPHVVTVSEVDLNKTSRLREANKDRYKKEGIGLTMLAFLCAAAVRALGEFPALNARVLDDSYVVLRDINLGVAVDAPDGLVVPNIKRADELSLRGLAKAIDDVGARAKSGKITADDLAGCSFSVSNPGIRGNLFGGAIIAQPNVGILRMGEIQKRVVVVDVEGQDTMAIHPVMFLALSYDHRIIDGVLGNAFLYRVTEILEKGDFEV
jgi:2-oxoglutarate dehydrogenase E2 component (dihydrolipoamide succinyltransferase)